MSKKEVQFYTARGYEMANREDSLTPSMEDYLEMIFRLHQKNGYTSVNELAISLNVQPPSVTKMIKKLDKKSLLIYEKYGLIQLTDDGEKIGEFLIERHNTIKDFFILLGATENIQQNVETIEHHISMQSFQMLSLLVSFLKENKNFLIQFNDYKKTKNE